MENINYNEKSKEELIEILKNKDKELNRKHKKINKINYKSKLKDKRIKQLEKENHNKDLKIAKLEQDFKKLSNLLETKINDLELSYEHNRLRKRTIFGSKSEKGSKYKALVNNEEIPNNNEKKPNNEENGSSKENDSTTNDDKKTNDKPKKEKKSRKKVLLDILRELVTLVKVVDLDFEKYGLKKEECEYFGYDSRVKLNVKALDVEVVDYHMMKYKKDGKFYEAELPSQPFEGSPLTPSLAANIINLKYSLGLPLYRIRELFASFGIPLSEATLCHYVEKSALLLEGIYQEHPKKLLSNKSGVMHVDETVLRVLSSNKKKCYLFVFSTTFWDTPVIVYEFSNTRSTKKLKENLKNYQGKLIVDGYFGYDSFPALGIPLQRCFIHCRRYFVDAIEALPKSAKASSPAAKAIELIDVLFDYERTFRLNKLTAEAIKERRNSEEYQKAVKAIDDYINSIEVIDKRNHLGKAVNYYKNNRDELYTYLSDGHLDISNNKIERIIKAFVLARRSFLFCKTEHGAETSARLFSIVQTAKANGLDVVAYLTYVFENVKTMPTEKLVPWSKDLPDKVRRKKFINVSEQEGVEINLKS